MRVVAANHHEANRTIGRAKWTLRMPYICLRSTYHHSRLDDLVLEAAYSKNLIRGSKLTSAFELSYPAQPRILGRIEPLVELTLHRQFKMQKPPLSLTRGISEQLVFTAHCTIITSHVWHHQTITFESDQLQPRA